VVEEAENLEGQWPLQREMLGALALPDQQALRLLLYLKHSPAELVGTAVRPVTAVILAIKVITAKDLLGTIRALSLRIILLTVTVVLAVLYLVALVEMVARGHLAPRLVVEVVVALAYLQPVTRVLRGFPESVATVDAVMVARVVAAGAPIKTPHALLLVPQLSSYAQGVAAEVPVV
jgi:hypothetical protein